MWELDFTKNGQITNRRCILKYVSFPRQRFEIFQNVRNKDPEYS